MTYLIDASGYLIIGLMATILFIIIYELVLYLTGRKIYWSSCFGLILLGSYLTIIFSVTVSPMYGFGTAISWDKVNLVPGQVLQSLVTNPLNFWGNMMMFLPLGLLVPLVSRRFRSSKRIVALGLSVSLLIEGLQLFLGRGTDIDDLILNTLGSGIGFTLYILIQKGIPALRTNSGIIMKATSKKINKDGMPIILFIGIILCSVMLTGFFKRNIYMKPFQENTNVIEENKNVIQLTKDGLVNSNELNENDKLGENNTSNRTDHTDTKMVENKYSKVPMKKKKSETATVVEATEEFQGISLEANSVYLINATDGKVLYSKNSDNKIAPASTAKMLTALTVISYCEPEDMVTVGEEISYAAADASRAGLREGNMLTIRQLLEGLLLPSGNDAAYVLAVYTGRKIAGNSMLDSKKAISIFLDKMNKRAKEIGADQTNMLSPDGYDTEGQYTTAHDLALIAKSLMDTEYDGEDLLKDIVKQDSIRECFADGSDVTWHNSNLLLDPASEFYYKNAVGLKTGSTDKAGKCLVSAAIINDKLYIAAVMGDSDSGRYTDTIKMFENLE